MNKFALMVKEVASPDLGRMGMELLSFTIKDVSRDHICQMQNIFSRFKPRK